MSVQQMLFGGRTTINLSISANQTTSYNVFTSAGSPTSSVDVILTVEPGVYIGGGPAGIDATGAWVAGSTLQIINNGYITGAGGDGGNGGNADFSPDGDGTNGEAGAAGISLGLNLTIDNTNGYVFGGGGGGGGGGGWVAPGFGKYAAGGGGGGQGYVGGSGGFGGSGYGDPDGPPGDSGSFSSAGAGGITGNFAGSGGSGGGWGQGGADGDNPSGSGGTRGSGGVGGRAIRLNGFSVTWLGGNNASQVKGAVS